MDCSRLKVTELWSTIKPLNQSVRLVSGSTFASIPCAACKVQKNFKSVTSLATWQSIQHVADILRGSLQICETTNRFQTTWLWIMQCT